MNTRQTQETQLYDIRDKISYYQGMRENAEMMITLLLKEKHEIQKFMKED